MFDDILSDFINQIRELMYGMLCGSYNLLFDNVNGQISTIAADVSVTPANYSNWGASVYTVIRTISDDVILPIGVLIITALMCYELINAVLEKNAMHEMDSAFIFKWLLRACISVLLLSYTLDISLAIFDLGGELATSVSSKFTASASINSASFEWDTMIEDYALGLKDDTDGDGVYDMADGDTYKHSVGEVIGMALIAFICKIIFLAMWVIIEVTLVGRMIEIFLYLSIAPIPFATLTNREWGNIGTNYVRMLAALALQSVLIVMCVGMYGFIIKNLKFTTAAGYDLSSATLQLLGCSVALLTAIRGSKNFAMSIMNAH